MSNTLALARVAKGRVVTGRQQVHGQPLKQDEMVKDNLPRARLQLPCCEVVVAAIYEN